jgi:hypothetical protein
MFGKMDIEKALKFYINSFPYKNFAERVVSGNYEISFGRWNHFDNNIHSLFSRKYNARLSVEQRWFIFTSVMNSLKVNPDEALNFFAEEGLREVQLWAMKKDIELMLRQVPFDNFQKFEKFPYNELFNYSINNYLVIYPNNERVNKFVTDLEIYKSASNEIETHKALDNFCKMFN